METSAQFHSALLHPRYWGVWFSAGLMRLLAKLPLKVQYRIGSSFGRLMMRLLPKRAKVAHRNLELCFPDMPKADREAMVVKNFEETGMAIFDSANAWWWSDKRVKRSMNVKGWEHIEAAQAEGSGIILLAAHCLMLEPGARVFGQMKEAVGVYRPHNNKLMEYFQVKGRLRSNKGLISKRDVRQMVKTLRAGDILWYTQDQDGGRRGSVFVPFFNIDAATAAGTTTLAKLGRAKVMPFFVERAADFSGYNIEIWPELSDFPTKDELADTARCNVITEELVRRRPEQYMWLHRRFKTRPNPDDPKLY